MGLGFAIAPVGMVGSQQIAVLAATRTQTPTGGWTDAWAAVGAVYGWVTFPKRSSLMERVAGDQPTDAVLAEIVAQDTVGITSQHRIKAADGTTYDIVGVQRQGDYVQLVGRVVA